MTPVRDQAIYARADQEAARQYREQLRHWSSHHDGESGSGVAEIDEAARQALLSNKPTSEAREMFHS